MYSVRASVSELADSQVIRVRYDNVANQMFSRSKLSVGVGGILAFPKESVRAVLTLNTARGESSGRQLLKVKDFLSCFYFYFAMCRRVLYRSRHHHLPLMWLPCYCGHSKNLLLSKEGSR